MSNFALLDSQFGEDNVVKQPRSARNTRGNHKYDGTIVNNKAVGYVPVSYDPAENQYPKMLFHPDFGKSLAPEMAKYAVGCVTTEQFQSAHTAFAQAMEKWNRANRTKLVDDEKKEKSLITKGWLAKPPARKENPAFDMSSDEI